MLALASRANAQKVTVDFDPYAAFSDYKTFMWVEPVHYPEDPLMEPRIMDAINAALTNKGLQEVPDGAINDRFDRCKPDALTAELTAHYVGL